MRWYVPAIVGVVLVVVIAFFFTGPSSKLLPSESLVVSKEPVEQSSGTRVVVTSTYFYPNNYTVQAGSSVAFLFNSPARDRNLTIPGLGKDIALSADKDFLYVTPKLVSGSFVIYCVAGCDRPMAPMTVTIE